MRIASTTASENIVRQIQQIGQQQTKLQSQVASGLRITQLEDDPAAAGRVLTLESERRKIDQFGNNANRALEIVQSTFGSLIQIKRISDRATELGTLGAGAQSSEQTSAYAAELDQLLEQALQQANGRLRNDYLFAGTAVDTAPYTVTRDVNGQITTVTFGGNTGTFDIPLSETATVTPGADSTTTQGIEDFLNGLVAMRNALAAGNNTAVTAAQTGLVATEDVFVSSLAQQGAVEMRIEINQSQQKDRQQNIQSLISSEVDVDLPTTIVRLNQAQLAYQASLQSSANIMRISLLDYIQ
jgi:flagellar hook-associated protein 3 FlgL